jgi:hypothetical protein
MNIDCLSRFQCCAFRTLFEILSGPLQEIAIQHRPELLGVSNARAHLWQLLSETLQVPLRSLTEIKPAFTKVRRSEDVGVATSGAIFLLKLETKTGRTNMPPADPHVLEISVIMHLVMDVPEWSVHRVLVGAVNIEAVRLIGSDTHEFAIIGEPT